MTSRARHLSPFLVVLASLIGAGPAAAEPGFGTRAQRSDVAGLSASTYARSFIRRSGSHLLVDGHRFRFGGANAENLGLRNYGPIPSAGQPLSNERYPTRFEVDDQLATLHEMGVTVVRAQTIGDTVGCRLCVEPRLGHFNPRAFREMDMVVAQARQYGVKIIGEFDGDANGTRPFGPPKPGTVVGAASTDWYCVWNHVSEADCPTATFEDPRILSDYERHMKSVLDHVNPYTHLAYKNDPTISGWVDGNNLWLLNATPLPRFQSWLAKVAADFKSIDHRQLFVDIDAAGGDYLPPADTFGLGPNLGPAPVASVIRTRGVDMFGQEWYPKDFPNLNPTSPAASQIHLNARTIAGDGKVYATIEYGWDHYNYDSESVLHGFLAGLGRDHNVSGDAFWELSGHASGHGWQAIPANERCQPTCKGLIEDGSWWALYYTGRLTASNTAADMAARAQIIRTAAFGMDGFGRVPRHELPPAPRITSVRGGHVVIQGSAGAARYSIQKMLAGRWTTPCRRCTTDNADGWQDPSHQAGCYRAIPYNLDRRPGPPSPSAGRACRVQHGALSRPPVHWVGAWSSPPVQPGRLAGSVPFYTGTGGRTVRDIVHITLGGHRVRVRLSNVFGSATARFTDVRVAKRAHAATLVPGSVRRLRFGGSTSVSLRVGHQVTSDPVAMTVYAGEDLAVSAYAPNTTGDVTTAGSLNHTNFISAAGDAAGVVSDGDYLTQAAAWYWIGGVDVRPQSSESGAIVALGDSITAGYNSTLNANRDWVDLLSDRLRATHSSPELSVLNAGIAGNNLHENTLCFGQSGLVRMDRDVFAQTGVRDVILDEGANDITHPHEPPSNSLYPCLAHRVISAAGMIANFKLAAARIHAHHLRVIGVTVSPFGRYAYWSPAIEAERRAINHWIRTTKVFDGLIDFDRVLRDPAHPTWLNPRFDSGDHLHPNDAGHAAMACSIRLSMFARVRG